MLITLPQYSTGIIKPVNCNIPLEYAWICSPKGNIAIQDPFGSDGIRHEIGEVETLEKGEIRVD